jgi:uncharacterized protein involved in outer membrane biogenesis
MLGTGMVKFVFRWAFRLLLLAIVLVVALLLLKDTLIKSATERRMAAETGLPVRIGKMEVGLLTPTVTILDFRLYNLAEFGGSPFIDMPELHMEYDRTAMAQGKLHFKLIRLDLAEINVVQNAEGQTNLEMLQARQTGSRRQMDLAFSGIDTLNLTLGQMKYTQMSQPQKPRIIKFGLKNEILTNVRSPADLAGVLVKIALKNGGNIFGEGGLFDPLGALFHPARPQGAAGSNGAQPAIP